MALVGWLDPDASQQASKQAKKRRLAHFYLEVVFQSPTIEYILSVLGKNRKRVRRVLYYTMRGRRVMSQSMRHVLCCVIPAEMES